MPESLLCLRPVTLLIKRLWLRFFSVNCAKYLTITFLENTSGRLFFVSCNERFIGKAYRTTITSFHESESHNDQHCFRFCPYFYLLLRISYRFIFDDCKVLFHCKNNVIIELKNIFYYITNDKCLKYFGRSALSVRS